MRQFTYYKYEKNGRKCIAAVTHYRGRVVKGVAVCDPQDTYDEEKGKLIADLKCSKKVCAMRLSYFQNLYISRHKISDEAYKQEVTAKLKAIKEQINMDSLNKALDKVLQA